MATLKCYWYNIRETPLNEVILIGKDEKGRICEVHTYFDWYFYVRDANEEMKKELDEFIKAKGIKARTELVEKNYIEKPMKLIKVYTLKKYFEELRKFIKEKGWHKAESDINVSRKFLADTGYEPFEWLIVEGEIVSESKERVVIKANKIERTFEHANPKVLAFDIEVYSETFPNPQKDPIISIAFYGDDFKGVIGYKGNPDIKVSNELELLEKFNEIIRKVKPDIIVTYNGDTFDLDYIYKRAKLYNLKVPFYMVSKKKEKTTFNFYEAVHIDLMTYISTIYKTQLSTVTYSLEEVAQEMLGEGKEGTSEEMIENWKKEDYDRVYSYNLRDAELTYKLFKLIEKDFLELAKLVNQAPFDVARFTYGQIVEWYLIKKSRKFNEVVPNNPKFEEVEKRKLNTYAGAFVYEPKPGLYTDITVLDFTSLYPSIILEHNVSPGTLKCEHKECKETNSIEAIVNGFPRIVWFCKKRRGFIPSVLEHLYKRRVELKKKLKQLPKDSEEYKIIDAKQKVLKIIINATYGYMGFPNARWYCLECAAAVAAWGRKYIQYILKRAEEEGFKVVYGDSVLDTKVRVKENGIEKEVYISELFEKYYANFKLGEKEYAFPPNLEIFDGERWVKVYSIIRHKVEKEIYQVNDIFVTADHSLIINGKPISPKQIREFWEMLYKIIRNSG